jgi:hypothetical protein
MGKIMRNAVHNVSTLMITGRDTIAVSSPYLDAAVYTNFLSNPHYIITLLTGMFVLCYGTTPVK